MPVCLLHLRAARGGKPLPANKALSLSRVRIFGGATLGEGPPRGMVDGRSYCRPQERRARFVVRRADGRVLGRYRICRILVQPLTRRADVYSRAGINLLAIREAPRKQPKMSVTTNPPIGPTPPTVQSPKAPPPSLGPEQPNGRRRWYRRGWVIGLIGLFVGIGLGAASSGSKTKTTTVTAPAQTVVQTVPGTTKTVAGATKTVTVPGPTKTVTAPGPTKTVTVQSGSGSGTTPTTSTTPPSSLTTSQQNAVAAANNYLSMKGFSRQGLIDQLSSSAGDGYPVNDATVAVDSLHVDWNAEAVKSAKDYLKMTSFSCQGLIDQLSSSAGEQFTAAQAQYAASKVGLC